MPFGKTLPKESIPSLTSGKRSYENLLPTQLKAAADATCAATVAAIDRLRKAMKNEMKRLAKQREELKGMKDNVSKDLSHCKRQISSLASPGTPVNPLLHDLFIVMVLQRWKVEDKLVGFDDVSVEGDDRNEEEGQVEEMQDVEGESNEDEDMPN